MTKIFDILPPQKKKKITKQEKKRQKRSSIYFIFFLAIIAGFFIVFWSADKMNLSPKPINSPTPSKQSEQPVPTPSNKTKNQLTIKILNGTGRVEELQKVKTMLQDSNFPITTTENALNLYDSTIIYYQPAFENYANDLATVLKSYNAKTQKFSQETRYDIVIVIGTK